VTPGPLLAGEDETHARRVVDALASALLLAPLGEDPSLAHGHAGFAMVHAALEPLFPGRGHRARAVDHLGRAYEALESQPLDPSLYGGFTGIAFAAELLGQAGVVDDDPSAHDAIDEALLEMLALDPYPRPFDLIVGAVGIGVYAIERARAGRGVALLAGVVRVLDRLAVQAADGPVWRTLPSYLPPSLREERPDAYEDLGLAHGAPGVLPILAAASRLGAEAALASRLVHAAGERLGRQRVAGFGGRTFPQWRAPWAGAPGPTRAAWCYGDPGAATGWWLAGDLVGASGWCAEATETMLGVAARPAEECGAVDACLCHGSAGLAHVLHRWYRATGDVRFADAARGWFREAVRAAEVERGAEAFAMLDFDGDRAVRVRKVGWLEGTAGVVLALADALSTEGGALGWDRALLVTLPLPRATAVEVG
jgi:hypothetical protein